MWVRSRVYWSWGDHDEDDEPQELRETEKHRLECQTLGSPEREMRLGAAPCMFRFSNMKLRMMDSKNECNRKMNEPTIFISEGLSATLE